MFKFITNMFRAKPIKPTISRHRMLEQDIMDPLNASFSEKEVLRHRWIECGGHDEDFEAEQVSPVKP